MIFRQREVRQDCIIDSEGVQPITTDQVRVAHKGYFTNGNVFDQSPSEGISFNLQQVINGWTEGITYFKEGGSGMLFVPSHLGYGFQAVYWEALF